MSLKKIIQDTIPVILGVLIALLIGNLKQRYDDSVYLSTMFEAMNEEAVNNLEAVNEVLEKHTILMDTIDYYVEDPEISIVDILQKTDGLQVPSILTVAWKSVANSRAELVDYKTLFLLNKIERSNQLLDKKADRIVAHVLADLYTAKKEDKAKLLLLLTDVIDSELALQKLHQEFLGLEEIKKEGD